MYHIHAIFGRLSASPESLPEALPETSPGPEGPAEVRQGPGYDPAEARQRPGGGLAEGWQQREAWMRCMGAMHG